MFKNNVPYKVAFGYGIVATILIVAIVLVYSNTRSLLTISKSVRDYAKRQEQTDSAMSRLLKEEQENLQLLNNAIDKGQQRGALRRRVKELQQGTDSVIVNPKTTEKHHVKTTTVEVARSRKGFFRRFADLFRSAHEDTISIKRDSSLADVDTITKSVDISHKVARILNDADKEERDIAYNRQRGIRKELNDLKYLTTFIAENQTKKMESLRQKDREAIHQNLENAMRARQQLILQIIFLSILAILSAIILLWRIYVDSKKEQAYREALERANAETRRVMEQRERLLLTITHDIKAPAASITGFTELLDKYISSTKGKSLLENVHDSAVHLSQLVASLLDYQQLENGAIKINNTEFQPSKLASQCIMGMKAKADAKGLNLITSTASCDGISCKGDSFRIRQIIDNLLSNAIKYTDKGTVTLTVFIKDKILYIEVRDTGKGIAKENLSLIFQAFKRLSNAQGIEGAGLGLSIVSQLVKLLGGNINVTSKLGEGSTFYISLPIEVLTDRTLNHVVAERSYTEGRRNFKNHQLLILDDDLLQLKLLQELIRQIDTSWEIAPCSHVTEALVNIHNIHPSLMLMDIEMPEMKGTDFIRHIDHHDMTVIAMTAHDESILPQLREAGFDDCLFKPINAEKLSHVLGVEMKKNILDFAGGDLEDREEILDVLNKEMGDFHTQLSACIESQHLDKGKIASIAHKLLPLAKMLNFNSIEDLEMLTPEKIESVSDTDIIKCIRNTITEINQNV